MFGVTAADSGEESHKLYTEMTQIQKHLFSNLGIHFQVIDTYCTAVYDKMIQML